MKKLFLLVLLAVLMTPGVLSAQTTKGNFVVAGGSGLQFIAGNSKYVYDGTTSSETKSSSISFMPSFGYFVMDNLAIGLSASIGHNSSKYEDGDKDKSNTLLLMPTAIYYFPMDGKIRPLAQVAVGLSSQSYTYIPETGSEDKNTYSGLAFSLGGGLAYFVNENISFDLGLSYIKTTLTDADDDKYKIKQGNFGANIGVAVYF